jgi:hypothetical protein
MRVLERVAKYSDSEVLYISEKCAHQGYVIIVQYISAHPYLIYLFMFYLTILSVAHNLKYQRI